MAPEVVRRSGHGRAADAWSFGCVLAHMGARAPPFSQLAACAAGAAHAAETVMEHIVQGDVSPLALLDESNAPPPILALARTCVVVPPESRPDFQAIAGALVERNLG